MSDDQSSALYEHLTTLSKADLLTIAYVAVEQLAEADVVRFREDGTPYWEVNGELLEDEEI